MIVLDTTVLVYAVGTDHPLHEPCQQLIRAIAGGAILATTTIEVVQEFTHVRARRRDRKEAAELARDYIELRSLLLVVEERTCAKDCACSRKEQASSPASRPSIMSSLTPMASTGCWPPRKDNRTWV